MASFPSDIAKISERLRHIKAGFEDVTPPRLGLTDVMRRVDDKLGADILHKRSAALALDLYHLKDDARGLARRTIGSADVVEEFCERSRAVRLCISFGDTYKHGVGGRSRNNTVMPYELMFAEKSGPRAAVTDRVIGSVMLIVDDEGEPHQFDLIAKEAMRDWLAFLRDTLSFDITEWGSLWNEQSAPPGTSIYSALIPPALLQIMKDEAAGRRLAR
jgi:hypothetical protein